MNAFCPNCEKETTQHTESIIAEVNIRGEMIPIHLEYQQCDECGSDFEIPKPGYDPVDAAYREYRCRKGMVQPEEIRKFRKDLGLTQKEFSDILGIGIATLNRYENGALASEGHDQILRLCMQSNNFLSILKDKPDILPEETRSRVIQRLTSRSSEGRDLLVEAIEHFGSYSADLSSGYLQFDSDKFFQAIQFFCFKDRVFKTKLMKLLFYADFLHFKNNGVSITGARYAHATHGPVPDQFQTWLVAILDWEKGIYSEEQTVGDYIGEVFISAIQDVSGFSTSELAVLAFVKNRFQSFTANQIREISHREKGYLKTRDGEFISYGFAQSLQI